MQIHSGINDGFAYLFHWYDKIDDMRDIPNKATKVPTSPIIVSRIHITLHYLVAAVRPPWEFEI